MRLSVIACIAGVLGALGGGWLAGGFAGLGVILIILSGLLIAWGFFRDDGMAVPGVHEAAEGPQTLHEVITRARAS